MNQNDQTLRMTQGPALKSGATVPGAPGTAGIPDSIMNRVGPDGSLSVSIPDYIGPYRIISRLGSGGFGVVYHAEQLQPVQREVAVKVIRPGIGGDEIARRFDAEKQTLALMHHPNVAAVLDAGTTEDGLPYFVMELVRGEELTKYCDARSMGVRQRVELFMMVCLAVHHAHQKAIIHRDLKPSTIIVTEVDGRAVPKVIDFGIAKALNKSTPGDFRDQTIDGAIMGTVHYMSPEQAGADADIDTRSDIYALGVILFELIVGETPLSRIPMGNIGIDRSLREVREGPSLVPSAALRADPPKTERIAETRATTCSRLIEEVKGELDWIVLKAMEKDRDRRYDSAVAFGEDLRRFVAKEPVLCGPPSRWYTVKKLIQRNKFVCLSSAAMMILLLASSMVVTWLWRIADSDREIAQQSKLSVERLVNSMLYNLGSKLESIGKRDLLKEATQQAKEYYFINSSSNPEDQRNAAAMWSNLGDVQLAAGESSEARKSYSEAVAIHEQLAQSEQAGPRAQRDLSVGYARLSDIALADSERVLARGYMERVVAIRERLASAASDDNEAQRDLSIGYARLGDLEQNQGDGRAAREFWRKAIAVLEAIALREPDSVKARHDLSIAYRRMGHLAQDYGDGPAARVFFGRARDCLEMVLSRSPSDSHARRGIRAVIEDAGKLAEMQGDMESAKAFYGTSITISEQLLDEKKGDEISRLDLSRSYSRLGELGAAENDTKLAYEFLGKAINVLRQISASDPENVQCLRDLCSGYQKIAAVASSRGDLALADQFYGQVVPILEKICQYDPENFQDQRELALAYGKTAAIAGSDSQRASAIKYRESALEILKRLVQVDPVSNKCKLDLAQAHYALSKVTKGVVSDDHLRECRRLIGEVGESGKNLSEEERRMLGIQH